MRYNALTAGLFLCRHRNLKNTIAAASVVATLSFICAATVSCTQLYDTARGTDTITVFEPVNDYADIPAKTYSLLWIDENNSVRNEHFSSESQETPVSLVVKHSFITPVLLFCDGAPHPKGLVYPFESEPTEEGGFMAHILYRLINEYTGDKNEIRLFCSHFNWPKFINSVKRLDDPWQCDQDSILNSITEGSFTANSFL